VIEIDKCPCCQEGQLGYRLCGDRETVVILCSECAMVWLHPSKLEADQARDPVAQDFARHHPQVQLRNSRWATPEEVSQWGWAAYLLKPSELLENS
jgi:hypothetical protein